MNIRGVQTAPGSTVKKAGAEVPNSKTKPANDFHDFLFRELANTRQINVSAHAQKRMQERNIILHKQDWEKINSAVDRAEAKGAVNSLLIHGGTALLVSVKNRTVISAMDEEGMKEHIFTNIDSAVIIR